MTIGNKPEEAGQVILGKRYWWLSIGEKAISYRYLTEGWYAFEFVVLKPYGRVPEGESHPLAFRFAFAFWLPFYSI